MGRLVNSSDCDGLVIIVKLTDIWNYVASNIVSQNISIKCPYEQWRTHWWKSQTFRHPSFLSQIIGNSFRFHAYILDSQQTFSSHKTQTFIHFIIFAGDKLLNFSSNCIFHDLKIRTLDLSIHFITFSVHSFNLIQSDLPLAGSNCKSWTILKRWNCVDFNFLLVLFWG